MGNDLIEDIFAFETVNEDTFEKCGRQMEWD